MVSPDDCRFLKVLDSDFSEMLLFSRDLDRGVADVAQAAASANHPVQYVHVQEFMDLNGTETMVDLSSEDEAIRTASVRIVRITREVAALLGDVPVVIHPGGIRPSVRDKAELESSLVRSLTDLEPRRLLLENMPWYYWYRKRERFMSNTCVSIEDMTRFEGMVEGFTLDTCHGFLSVPDGDPGYCGRFMDTFGDKVAHIHASDAKAPDKEGLQIGDGDVDLSFLRDVNVPILAEVWNGHANDGEGFRIAIERLRSLEKES
ncbi:MAG: sugar phosphate isomerase/epimerase [Thermoplasmata archaeon]|nr:sugar phosphate isomerase/epimerase [Thermoplasmata archaeon]